MYTRKFQQGLEHAISALQGQAVVEVMTGATGPSSLGDSDVSPREGSGGHVLSVSRIIALD